MTLGTRIVQLGYFCEHYSFLLWYFTTVNVHWIRFRIQLLNNQGISFDSIMYLFCSFLLFSWKKGGGSEFDLDAYSGLLRLTTWVFYMSDLVYRFQALFCLHSCFGVFWHGECRPGNKKLYLESWMFQKVILLLAWIVWSLRYLTCRSALVVCDMVCLYDTVAWKRAVFSDSHQALCCRQELEQYFEYKWIF